MQNCSLKCSSSCCSLTVVFRHVLSALSSIWPSNAAYLCPSVGVYGGKSEYPRVQSSIPGVYLSIVATTGGVQYDKT